MILTGIGSVWDRQGITGIESGADLCPYLGERANLEYLTISGCPTVPTENDGGPGRACGHWDEECLGDELMTGIINTTATSILSRITIATLEDIGYNVDYSTADPYDVANLNPSCLCNATQRRLVRDGASQQHGARSRHKRRLSDESRQDAIEYGQSLLLQRSQTFLIGRTGEDDDDDELIYVGDKFVTVFVEENGFIYDVVVRSDR
jgi:Leishmanolysin